MSYLCGRMRNFSRTNGAIEIHGILPAGKPSGIVYLLEPEKVLPDLEDLAGRYGIALVSVFGMDWDNDLTPWPAPNVRRNASDFSGGADRFLNILENELIPEIETEILGVGNRFLPSQRALIGISLAGLFAVWTLAYSDSFASTGSVSGSFWYDGFAGWLDGRHLSRSAKNAYLSVGNQEKESRNPRFASVEDCTKMVCSTLKNKGMNVFFELNPGNHIADGVPRIRKAIEHLMDTTIL